MSYTGVHPDMQVHAGLHLDTHVYTSVHPDIQVHTGFSYR